MEGWIGVEGGLIIIRMINLMTVLFVGWRRGRRTWLVLGLGEGGRE